MHLVFAAAESLGLSVRAASLPAGLLGADYADHRRILIDRRLTPEEEVETLAHEIGHAVLGHDRLDDPRFEAEADTFAARMLVDSAEYERLERLQLCAHDIAEDLGVTLPILEAFRAQLGRDTFVTRAAARLRERCTSPAGGLHAPLGG